MDDNISDFIDNLNLSIGSKMHLQRLVSEFPKKSLLSGNFFLRLLKIRRTLILIF